MSTGQTARQPSQTDPDSRPVAVIDIGATSIRMAIAEIDGAGRVRPLESLTQAVTLGKDTFTQRRLRKSSIEDAVRVLRSYGRLLKEYGITKPDQMRVVATSAVREAMNRLAFVDRVYIATGIEIEPLDEAEVNRITYMGIQPLLRAEPAMFSARTVVVEIGGGSTEILLVRGGNVLFSNTYRLGSLRLLEMLEKYDAPRAKQRAIMENQIRRVVEQICEQIKGTESPPQMVAIGGDMRFAAANILGAWEENSLAIMSVESLEAFTRQLLEMNEDEIVQKYSISFPDAETVGPALLSYVMLARALGLETIHVAETNLRDGLLHDLAIRDFWTAEFRSQIIRSATTLGRKFHFDEQHAKHTAQLSRRLFSELQSQHQLDSRMELILYLAALLHEIGMYINVRSNHKHAMYLIRNSELFGLRRRDVLLVALVARYHRRSSPQPDHEGYAMLDRSDRVAVCKLAAILRVAIALDESRSQRINNIRCRDENNRIVIAVSGVDDVSLEQLALRQSGGLFDEVFGKPVMLRTIRKR